MNFNDFKFDPAIALGVKKLGYVAPTPIQAQAIPAVMEGKDVMGLAQTGTGKTAAFVLPLMQRIIGKPRGKPKILIVAPTRELAQQTHDFIESIRSHTGIRSVPVYGGVGMNPQITRIRSGVEAVVACPGRLLDLVNQRELDLSGVEALVIDEADRMFDMGFLPDVRRIVQAVPRNRQTLLFSATMPSDIRRLAKDILHNPEVVQVAHEAPLETISHAFYPVNQHLKTPLLLEILKGAKQGSVLVFTRTKHRAKRLGAQLERAGHSTASLQGNLSQNKRQAALDGFRSGDYRILVATDIAARGIDVSSISLVVNYDLPDTADAYTHRIGRTGRMERSGEAYSFITKEDEEMVRVIERSMGQRIERRTLDEFDYSAPAPPREPRGGGFGHSRPFGGGQHRTGGGGRSRGPAPQNRGGGRGGNGGGRGGRPGGPSGGRGPSRPNNRAPPQAKPAAPSSSGGSGGTVWRRKRYNGIRRF